MEQAAVSDGMIRFDLPISDPLNADARVMSIASLRCPSDPGPDTFVLEGGGIYVGSGAFEPTELARGNYLGVFGVEDFHDMWNLSDNTCKGSGCFFHNSNVRFRDITDGLSCTFMVGERSSKLAPSTWVGVLTGGLPCSCPSYGRGRIPAKLGGDAGALFPQFQQLPPLGHAFSGRGRRRASDIE